MPTGPVPVSASVLEALTRDCFEGLGVPAPDAQMVAEVLVYANLRGLEAHGVHRVPAYMRRVERGLAGGTENLREAAGSGPVRRLDAAHALGPAAAVKAIDLACELAREHGIALVSLGRSTHLGVAGYYVHRAARRELVAVVASNAPAAVAPHGASEPLLGTNPLAVGAPAGRHGEFVLDGSMSVVSREKIKREADASGAIPLGLAIDMAGRPTTSAAEAMAGSLLPLGGAKGSGLAFAIAAMTAVLGEAELDHEIGSMYRDFDRPQNVGQLFFALDPWRFTDRETGLRRFEELVDRLHSLRPVEAEEPVLMAGERRERLARERLEGGIPIAVDEVEKVAIECERLGLNRVGERARILASAIQTAERELA